MKIKITGNSVVITADTNEVLIPEITEVMARHRGGSVAITRRQNVDATRIILHGERIELDVADKRTYLCTSPSR